MSWKAFSNFKNLHHSKEFAAKEKLEIVKVRFGTAQIFCPPDPSPPQAGEDRIPSHAQRGEDRIPFELFQEYTASYFISG